MSMSVIFTQMLQLMLMMLLGYFLYRIRILSTEFDRQLTGLLLNVTMPCLILSSVLTQTGDTDGGSVLTMFIAGLIFFLVLSPVGLLAVKLLRLPKPQQGLYTFMFVFSNVGFMGFPVISAVLGEQAVFYTAVFNILFNLATFTIGIVMMYYGTEHKAKLRLKEVLAPGTLSGILALIFYLLNVRFPAPLTHVIDSIGDVTTPLAMLLMGASLASMDLKEIFNDWRVYLFSAVKQIALPLALWPLLRLLVQDAYVLNILFLLVLMPVANVAVLFATQYGQDEKLAAKTVFLTTVLSMATIPLLAALCLG